MRVRQDQEQAIVAALAKVPAAEEVVALLEEIDASLAAFHAEDPEAFHRSVAAEVGTIARGALADRADREGLRSGGRA